MKKETKAYFDRAEKYYELREYSRAIEEYKKALSTINASNEPETYADIQNNLGIAYRNLPTGDREENIRKAIECYEKALEIRTKEASPQNYATTQNNLGVAYSDLPIGDREENIRKAIECYEKSLEIRTKEAFPQEYAMTQNNLGNAYCELPTGDWEENIRKAIECYKKALEIRTKEAFPQGYAMTQNNLGAAYIDLPTGDKEENLRKAIECYEKTLEIWTKEAFPQDYATTHNNLGNAYINLPTGDKEENLRKAIECYEKTLEIRTKEAFPQGYAMTQNNLGAAYIDLPTGDKEGNLRKVINCYKESSEGYEKVGLISNAESMKDKIKIVEKMIVDIQEKKAAESEGNVTEAKEIEEKIDAEQTRLNIRQIFESFENKEKIFEEIEANKKRFSEYVNKNRRIDNDEPELVVLRRFNSYTPILTTMNPQSRGGGYFINFGGYGAVIDPGFNFIQNFFETGYGIADIDAIFITHAHNDHTGDLESIITLVHEYNEKQPPENKKRISLYLNRTAYIKFAAWLDLEREIIKDMQIISEKHGFIEINDTLKVHALLAEHKDIVADKGAVGFLFDWKGRKVFFTGDSKCSKEYIEKLRKHGPVDLLILHMGETTRSEFDYNEAADIDKQCLGNHLGMIGVIRTIQAMQPGLALISEFGEEFKGNIRHVIANKLKEGLKVNILAADIRLRIKLDDNGIFCPFCDNKNYVAFENIKTSYKQCLPTSAEEINALYYYCDCHSHEELDNKLKDVFRAK